MGGLRDARTDARTITVTVTFFADLRRFLPRGADGPQRYTMPGHATVHDLLAGSSVTFDAVGERELKGLAGSWRLYEPHP